MSSAQTCRCEAAAASRQAPLRAVPAGAAMDTARQPGLVGRGGLSQRAARVQQAQRAHGNRAAQGVLRRMASPQPGHTLVQRDSLNPLEWASGLLGRVRGDAEGQQVQVNSDASVRARELQDQGAAGSAQLQNQATTQGSALQGDAALQGAQLEQQATGQGAALNGQAGAQAAQLTGQASGVAGALQQEASASTTHLQGDEAALENTARATEAAVEGSVAVDAAGLQTEAEAGAGQVHGHWRGLETQSAARAASLTARTQAAVDQKTALVDEYRGPGPHDPERFQRRWHTLQGQIAPLEQEQASLGTVEGAADTIVERASALWAGLGQRGQALMNGATQLAGAAWAALQGGWAALQGAAAGALAALQGRVGAAVSSVKAQATRAWTGLQGAASRAWTGLQGLSTGFWTAVQGRANAAWVALQGMATVAWTALQSVAGSLVGGLADKIRGIVSRINGAVSRIIDLIAGAVSSVLSRLGQATSAALDSLRRRAGAAWNALKGLGGRAADGLNRLGGRAWEGLKGLGTRAWGRLKDLGTRAWEGLKHAGGRAWEGLKSLGQRAWSKLKAGWDWLKTRAQSAWAELKAAWERVKRQAHLAWEAVKRKASQAMVWLETKWAALKALVRRAWAWLKAKWEWLKSKVKLTIRIPDIQLFSAVQTSGRSLFSKSTGNVPIAGIDIETEAGPIALDAHVRGDVAAGFLGGTIGPGMLRNVSITLAPLQKKFSGEGELHIAASTGVGVTAEGVLGGSAYWSGLGGGLEGGLRVNGILGGSASYVGKGAVIYEEGKLYVRQSAELEPCLHGTLMLDAVGRVKVGVETPGEDGDFDDGPACALPNATPSAGVAGQNTGHGPGGPLALPPAHGAQAPAPGNPPAGANFGPGPSPGGGGGIPALPVQPGNPKARASQGKRHEITLWEGTWALGEWSSEKCWKLGTRIAIGGSGYQGGGGSTGGGGSSGTYALEGGGGSLRFSPAPLPLGQIVSSMMGSAKATGKLGDVPAASVGIAASVAGPTAAPGPTPVPGRMRAQVQQGRLHFGSAVAVASDPRKGVTAYEFELAQSMAINNWWLRHADPRNRKPGEPAPPAVPALLGGVHKAKSAQSKDIRTRIVPSGGVSRGGDINDLRQCTDGFVLLNKGDCDRRELDPIRLDVENLEGHNLRCTR